jgi:hypothetical protein
MPMVGSTLSLKVSSANLSRSVVLPTAWSPIIMSWGGRVSMRRQGGRVRAELTIIVNPAQQSRQPPRQPPRRFETKRTTEAA